MGCAVIADTIFVVGGFDGSQFLPYVEKYDQLRNVWVECEGMNQGRSGLSVVSYRGSLFALGGYAGKGALRTVERYDLTTNRWYSVGNLNVPRSGLSAAIVQDRIVIFGLILIFIYFFDIFFFLPLEKFFFFFSLFLPIFLDSFPPFSETLFFFLRWI